MMSICRSATRSRKCSGRAHDRHHPGQPRADHVRGDVRGDLLRLPGGVRARRHRADLRGDRVELRRSAVRQPVQHRAAHVGRRGDRSGAGVDPDVHLHGRDPRAQWIGQGHAVGDRNPAQARAGRIGGCSDGDGNDPGRTDRRGRRGGDHAVADRAAAAPSRRLQQTARGRHRGLRWHPRYPDPAGHHAGGHGGDAQHFGWRAVRGRCDARPAAVGTLSSVHLRRRDRRSPTTRRKSRPTTGRRPLPNSGG